MSNTNAEGIRVTTEMADFFIKALIPHFEATYSTFSGGNVSWGFYFNTKCEGPGRSPCCCFSFQMQKEGMLFPRWQITKLIMEYFHDGEKKYSRTTLYLQSSHSLFLKLWDNEANIRTEFVNSLSQEDCLHYIENFLHGHCFPIKVEHGLK